MANKFANAFDDLTVSANDYTDAFADIPKVQTQDYSEAFSDVSKQKSIEERIKERRELIKERLANETPSEFYPPLDPEKLTDEEIKKQLIVGDLIQRPLEFISSPLAAITESLAKGTETNWNPIEMGKALIPPLRDWGRPLLSERENVPSFSKAAGIKNPFGALAFDVVIDPTNLLFSSTLLKTIKRLQGMEELAKGMAAARATKEFEIGERFITPTFTKEGKLSTIGRVVEPTETGGTLKNLPAIIEPRPRNVFQFDVNIERKQPFKTEQLVAKNTIEQRTGKKLNVEVSAGVEPNEKLFRLKDKTGKTYVEVGLKPNPETSNLMLNWLNIDEKGIDIAKPRFERGGKPVQHIPGAYDEIHNALEIYANNNGYKTIGVSEFGGGTGRLKNIGFVDVPLDDVGKVPYTMVKRVGQNVPFEAPDFLNKYKKLIPQQKLGFNTAQEALEIADYAERRSMFFDISKDNKFVFYDKLANETARFDNIKDAGRYIESIPISKSNYWVTQQHQFKTAEQLYDLSSSFYNSKAVQEIRKGFPYAAGVGRREVVKPGLQISTLPHPEPTIIKKLVDDAINIAKETNDLFDIGTGEIVAVAKGRIPVRESYISPLSQIKDTGRDFYYNILTAKGWIMPSLQYFERHGEAAKEIFYRRFKIAELRETIEKKNIRKVGMNQFNLSRKEGRELGNYAISLDENGAATLKSMKEVVPTWEQLNGKQQAAFNFGRAKFDEYFQRINSAREFAGKDPLTYRGDYFTFFRNFDELEKMGYHLDDSKNMLDHVMEYVHKNTPSLPYEIERKGGKIKLENNYSDVFNKYADDAIHYIHTTPAIAINRALLEPFKVGEKIVSIRDKAPAFYKWTNRLLDDIAGQKHSELPGWFDRIANKMNRNVGTAYLTYNTRSEVIQITSLTNSFSELGRKYFFQGFGDWLTNHPDIMKKSNLITRQFEQGYAETFRMIKQPGYGVKLIEAMTGYIHPTLRDVSRAYHGGKDVIVKAGMTPLTFLDSQAAQITWAGAYKKGKNYLHLGEEAAINYANDIVVKTQGSGRLSDLSQAQRGTVGKTLFNLQTFVINNWSFLMRDVLGVNNPTMKTPDRMWKTYRLILGMAIANTVFEDILGTYSPFPSPLKAYMDEMDNSGVPINALLKSGKEMTELIPGVGGAIRYGSHAFGPLSEVVGQATSVIAGRPTQRSSEEIAATLLGIPAVRQAMKIKKGIEEEAPVMETLLGIKKSKAK